MLIVGLTGGIASGKSTASHYFETLGTPVIDADIIARQCVQPGQAALQKISAQFGADIIDATGQLKRATLRTIVFNDADARKALETILHPLIQAEMRYQIKRLSAPYCILAIPLLIETDQTDMVDRILLIDSDEKLQRQRLQHRDNLDDRTITAMIQAQASRQQRQTAADDIALNNGTIAELQTQLQQYHQRYLLLGQRKP